jgi:hypothetical protein
MDNVGTSYDSNNFGYTRDVTSDYAYPYVRVTNPTQNIVFKPDWSIYRWEYGLVSTYDNTTNNWIDTYRSNDIASKINLCMCKQYFSTKPSGSSYNYVTVRSNNDLIIPRN